ncbi:hypothetical protein [Kineococcus sp. SYSU DK002]|uniref:hypothetical protein n=1 Tax=Kineococcus sp. SYSU DK002 TaxID=3383123 RepID=UPI003D7C9C82
MAARPTSTQDRVPGTTWSPAEAATLAVGPADRPFAFPRAARSSAGPVPPRALPGNTSSRGRLLELLRVKASR